MAPNSESSSVRVTITNGRAHRFEQRFRPQPSLINRAGLQTKKRARVCVLSTRAAKALEQWGINQPCSGSACRHSHHSRTEIEEMIGAGILRWIGRGENVAAWKEARHLAIRRSGPVACVQLVDVGR